MTTEGAVEPTAERDRGLAITIIVASLAIALAALPALSRTDPGSRSVVAAAGRTAIGTDPTLHGRLAGEPSPAAEAPGPAVTVVLPDGRVIPLSAGPPAAYEAAPPAVAPAAPTAPDAPGAPTTAPPTPTTPTTPTTRFVRTVPSTTPGQRCATQVPPGYVDEAHAQLIFDGQSLSLVPDSGRSWPNKVMQRRFPDRRRAGAWRVVARGGTTYADRSGDAPQRVDSYPATPAAAGATDAILFDDGGETDLFRGATAQELFQQAADYHRARRSAGYLVIVGFTIPAGGLYSAAQDQQRLLYNQALRDRCWSAGIDVLVDVAALPQLQDPHDPQWFDQSDGYGVHYTDAATDLVADQVRRAFP